MASSATVLQAFALGFALTATSAAQVVADAWPQRTVRVIVPNPAGIANDVIARLFAERLSSKWGQPVHTIRLEILSRLRRPRTISLPSLFQIRWR